MRLIDCKWNPRVHFAMILKRRTILLPCAALEVFRYTLLLMKLPEILGDSAGSQSSFLLRLLAAPNLLFPAMLFLLWQNEQKYIAFKPLMLLGKAVSSFASILFLARLLGPGTGANPANLMIILTILGCILVDAFVALIMITMRSPENTPGASIAGAKEAAIETVADN